MALPPITDAELAVGKPITQSLLTRLRDAAYAGGGASGGGAGLMANSFSADGTYTVPENVRSIAIAMRARSGNDGTSDFTAKAGPGGRAGPGGEIYGVFDVEPGDTITMDFDVVVALPGRGALNDRPRNRLAINVVVGSITLQVIQGANGVENGFPTMDSDNGARGGMTAGYSLPSAAGLIVPENTVIIRS